MADDASTGTEKDAAYWEAEAKKAFAQRDKFLAKLEVAEQRVGLSQSDREELERLKKAEAEAEEKRQLQAGEFDAAKKKLLDQKAEAESRAKAAEQRFAQKVVESAFAGATTLFGPTGRTVLTPEFAFAGMGRQVDYVPGEDGASGGIVVRGLDGEIIRGEDGQPAPFEAAMDRLIESWPNKQSILRSGQKAGSGSTGGSGTAALPVDRAALVERANQGDLEALAEWRATKPVGRTVEGAHWDKLAREKASKSG